MPGRPGGVIEHLRTQARSTAPVNTDSTDTVVLALTSQIDQLKKQHRQKVHALRAAVEQANGENLDLRRELARRGWTGANQALETDGGAKAACQMISEWKWLSSG